MTICRVDVSLVAAHHIGAHIWPPDGKNLCDDEDAEGFWFSPSLDGARALNDAEVSVLRRSRIELMQKPVRPLHSAGIHHNLMIVSTEFAALAEAMAPGRHQFVPLSDVWFQKAKEPSPGRYLAVRLADQLLVVVAADGHELPVAVGDAALRVGGGDQHPPGGEGVLPARGGTVQRWV